MNGIKRNALGLLVLFLVFGAIDANGQKAKEINQKPYTSNFLNPKGFFKIEPPAGWRTEQRPQDKEFVLFLGPENDVQIGVRISLVNFKTNNDIITAYKKADEALEHTYNQRIARATKSGKQTSGPAGKEPFRFDSVQMQEISFAGRPAVQRQSLSNDKKRTLHIVFLVDKVMFGQNEYTIRHHIYYQAPMDNYHKYLSVFQKTLQTYEPGLNINADVLKYIILKDKIKLIKSNFAHMMQNGDQVSRFPKPNKPFIKGADWNFIEMYIDNHNIINTNIKVCLKVYPQSNKLQLIKRQNELIYSNAQNGYWGENKKIFTSVDKLLDGILSDLEAGKSNIL